jgi:hypothetical protein
VAEWWSKEELKQSDRSERLQQKQDKDYDSWRLWSLSAIIAYNAGITALAIGLALVLVPPLSVHHSEAVLRWIAAVAVAPAICGIVWGAVSMVRRQRGLQLSRGDPFAD